MTHGQFVWTTPSDVSGALVGGIHRDVLIGGAGDDTLNGRARLDLCYGGSGVNTYICC